MKRSCEIEAKRMPDGGLHIAINCRKKDKAMIAKAINDAAQAWQDDTYGMLDRIRDMEHREKSRMVKAQTIDLKLETTKSVPRPT